MKNRLSELRQKRGLSQDELGTLVGVSRQTINAIERGRYEPRLALAFRLAEYFAVPVETIFKP